MNQSGCVDFSHRLEEWIVKGRTQLLHVRRWHKTGRRRSGPELQHRHVIVGRNEEGVAGVEM